MCSIEVLLELRQKVDPLANEAFIDLYSYPEEIDTVEAHVIQELAQRITVFAQAFLPSLPLEMGKNKNLYTQPKESIVSCQPGIPFHYFIQDFSGNLNTPAPNLTGLLLGTKNVSCIPYWQTQGKQLIDFLHKQEVTFSLKSENPENNFIYTFLIKAMFFPFPLIESFSVESGTELHLDDDFPEALSGSGNQE
jgi:hypothetical protein